MKTLWCKNQENPSDRISHAWAPLKNYFSVRLTNTFVHFYFKKTRPPVVKHRRQVPYNLMFDYLYLFVHVKRASKILRKLVFYFLYILRGRYPEISYFKEYPCHYRQDQEDGAGGGGEGWLFLLIFSKLRLMYPLNFCAVWAKLHNLMQHLIVLTYFQYGLSSSDISS